MTFSPIKEQRCKMKDCNMRLMQAPCPLSSLYVNPFFLDINRLLSIDMKSIIISKMSKSIIQTNPDFNATCLSGKVQFQHRKGSTEHSLTRFCLFPRFYFLVPNAQGRWLDWWLQEIFLPVLSTFWRIEYQCVQWFSQPIYASLASFDGETCIDWCFGLP